MVAVSVVTMTANGQGFALPGNITSVSAGLPMMKIEIKVDDLQSTYFRTRPTADDCFNVMPPNTQNLLLVDVLLGRPTEFIIFC